MKRYDCETDYDSDDESGYGTMVEDAAGAYVKHEDAERLRAALQTIVDAYSCGDDCADRMQDIARAALKAIE